MTAKPWYWENRERILAESRERRRIKREERERLREPRLTSLAYVESRSIPEPNSGCWLWEGAVDRKGYGRIARRTFGMSLAHRYAFCQAHGASDLLICYRCDNPSCVNPDHLFAGSPADNTRDMVRKGRTRLGVNAPNHRWTN